MGKGYKREAINYVGIMHRIPDIMSLDLVRRGNNWEGRYYINGGRHPYRRNKLQVKMWERADGTDIMVYEQGGDVMTLQRWLVEYGGATDSKTAWSIMKGNSIPIREFMHHNIRENGEGLYVPESVYEEYKSYPLETCNLYNWMCRLFGEAKTREAWERYGVTTDSKGDTIFWYRDTEGRLLHDKIMRYSMQGKRDKTYISRRFKVGNGFNQNCWFGSHLIKDGDDLYCVESEKSALIMSIVEPEKLWVASGGLSNIRDVDSHIWLYPDIDGIERWSAIKNAQIVEWWEGESVGDHDDIADLVIRKIKNGSLKV